MTYTLFVTQSDGENILDDLTDQINDCIRSRMKFKFQMDIIIDEVFSNIAKYAYQGASGPIVAEIMQTTNIVELVFKDGGPQFDPLDREEPDVTLEAEDRDIGGLGIFMVKRLVDDIKYEYVGNKNVLRMVKFISEDQMLAEGEPNI